MNEAEKPSTASSGKPSGLSTLLATFRNVAGSALAAAEALGVAPRNQTARRYRTAATWLFVGSSGLLLSAAFVHMAWGLNSILGEAIGWSGVALLQACVFCGLRYPYVNVDLDRRT